MGLSQSQPSDPAPTPPRSGVAAYFLPAPSAQLTHDHPRSAATAAAIEAHLLDRLPPDIVQRILDMAGMWVVCRRTNRRPLVVQAGGAEPHGVRGADWSTGQEGEVHSLRDGPGDVWYLVSAPVGCISDEQERAGREREDWEALDGPTVLGHERAAWIAASRKQRLERSAPGEDEDRIGEGEEEERGEEDKSDRPTWWLRRIVLETFSRDQGWTVNDDHYGTYVWSYSWFELGLLRNGREVGERHLVQFNVVAGQYFKVHRIELDGTHPLVQAARDGDRIVVWVRAIEPGWQNVVKRAALTLHAAPYAPQ
ncbi:hypothetical protein CC85DRAFT_288634 [Cutaneotrichosporon oleaginosum]|uniref:Uncharacterized protein n=1 Tax=Cutaneotrichosporon oleaginosum TaxID=879819 RepID=A0A0J0XE67_9TREE|nr:uncharacterized protein CC85DRAFT_288634 [Cutaneotrichosporon oleaginosum]KLT39377.1 hypothetical protein CC85DRAFT_288634 [Cutaneotrichosporon oleaginosum]TXT12078.1 hypothetical protein COLE_02488 [Cutaneotrichosporon oleaginosum]